MPKAIATKGPTVRMRVSESERRLILAMRGAEPPFRLPVVSGYREPRTVPELIEVIRCVLDVNFGFLIDGFVDQPNRFDIQGGYNDDDLPHTSVYVHEDASFDDVFDALTPVEAAHLAAYRAERAKGVADGR